MFRSWCAVQCVQTPQLCEIAEHKHDKSISQDDRDLQISVLALAIPRNLANAKKLRFETFMESNKADSKPKKPSFDINKRWPMGPVCIRHSIREICHPANHSVNRARWQAKMASIALWIQWRNAHGPIEKSSLKKKNQNFNLSTIKNPGFVVRHDNAKLLSDWLTRAFSIADIQRFISSASFACKW